MVISRTRRRRALAVLAVPICVVSCKSKEPPAPQATAPPAVTAAPTTTLPPPTTVPTPPPVWRAARWGMTKNEVLAAFPGEAQRLPRPADFAQPQPGSSVPAGSSDVAIPVYEADGTKFRVLFGFEGDALDRVHLGALKPAEATCGDIEKRLTEQHSKPSERGRTGTSLRGDEITWKRPDQTVVLACAGVPNLGFQTVTLDYMAPSKDVAKN